MSTEYILPYNPDDRILKKAKEIITNGGVICFPTDTSWVIAADAFHKEGVKKIYQIKGEEKSKHFSLLCKDIQMASDLARIDSSAFRTLKKLVPGHFTFIFEASKKMAKSLKASKTDHEVGIRFIPIDYIHKLIEVCDCPLISTNLTHEILGLREDEDIYSYLIEEKLGHKLGLILDPGEYEFVGPSTIISFCDPESDGAVVIREGSGTIK